MDAHRGCRWLGRRTTTALPLVIDTGMQGFPFAFTMPMLTPACRLPPDGQSRRLLSECAVGTVLLSYAAGAGGFCW